MLPCKYQWNVKCSKARRDKQNIWIYTNQRINQHLIVLKLDSASIDKSIALGYAYCESFTGSKIDTKYVNTVKSTT